VVRAKGEVMSQQPVEVILARQLSGCLSVPVVVVDTTGTVIYYNEPAEAILGLRFDETGRIDPEEADRLIDVSDEPSSGGGGDGARPLRIALEEQRPAHTACGSRSRSRPFP